MAEPPPPTVTTRDVAKGAGTTLLARLGALLEVVAQPLYVWMFGLATFGLYAVLWAAINLAENILDLGMTSSMQRVVPQARSEVEAVSALRASMLLGVGPCLIAAAIVSWFAPEIAPLFNASAEDRGALAEVIRLFAWALPLWAFVEIATSALRARRAFGPEIRLRIFWEQLFRLAIAVALWAGGATTHALFIAHLVSLAIVCVLCVRLLARHFDLSLFLKGGLLDRTFAESWRAGISALPANVVARMFGDGPPVVLNWLLPGSAGAVAGGLYAIARKVSSLVQIVRTAFAYVVAPLASAASQGRVDDVRDIYGFATRVSLAVATPIGLVLAASAMPILALFGPDAQVASAALAILLTARVVEATFGAAAPILQVLGGYRQQLVPSVAGLGVAAAIALTVMPGAGLTGMAIAVASGFVVAAILPVVQLWSDQGLHPFSAPFASVLGVTALVAAGALAVTQGWRFLPLGLQLPFVVSVLITALWLSARLALPLADRQALGKTGRALRLA